MTTYRTPTAKDAAALAELGRTTFVETFGHLYSAENLKMFVEDAYSVGSIAEDISDPSRIYRVAEVDGRMVGYCKLGLKITLDVDLGNRRGMELKQLYLRQDQVGSGIGQALMEWALEEARARQMEEVVLSVWSGNARAQRFYQKYGFSHIGNTYFMVGNHRDDEFLYGLRLAA
jgi:diamine N-acetyltransferase